MFYCKCLIDNNKNYLIYFYLAPFLLYVDLYNTFLNNVVACFICVCIWISYVFVFQGLVLASLEVEVLRIVCVLKAWLMCCFVLLCPASLYRSPVPVDINTCLSFSLARSLWPLYYFHISSLILSVSLFIFTRLFIVSAVTFLKPPVTIRYNRLKDKKHINKQHFWFL